MKFIQYCNIETYDQNWNIVLICEFLLLKPYDY